jgi:hypothetical protein
VFEHRLQTFKPVGPKWLVDALAYFLEPVLLPENRTLAATSAHDPFLTFRGTPGTDLIDSFMKRRYTAGLLSDRLFLAKPGCQKPAADSNSIDGLLFSRQLNICILIFRLPSACFSKMAVAVPPQG